MSAVVKAVGNVIGGVVDAVGDVVEGTVKLAGQAVKAVGQAVNFVAETVVEQVQTALENPIKTIATIAAVVMAPATGGASLQFIPAINAADTLAKGGSFEDALKSAAITYVAQGVGEFAGDIAGNYVGDVAGAEVGKIAGNVAQAAAKGVTSAALSGGDVSDALENALLNYAVKTGVQYAVNEAGNIVDSFGREAPQDVVDEIMEDADNQLIEFGPLPEEGAELPPTMVDNGDGTITQTFDDGSTITTDENDNVVSATTDTGEETIPVTPGLPVVEEEEEKPITPEEPVAEELPPTTVDNGDGTQTQTFDDGSTITTDESGNVINATTTDGQVILPGTTVTPDPYAVDNIGTRDEADILTGTAEEPPLDPYEVDNMGTRDEEDILTGTAGSDPLKNYLKNQFVNALTKGILGTNQPTSGSGGYPTRPPTGGYYGFAGVPTDLDFINFFGADMGAGLTAADNRMDPTIKGDIALWNPADKMQWDQQEDKIGGLGFASKFIYDEDSEQTDTEQAEKERILEEIRARGWMTDEERQMLESENLNSQYFNYGDKEPADMSPWLAAEGGLAQHNPEFYSEGGTSIANRYVKGDGDGTSDSVPAMLASGEFVIPADVVSGLGNGDNDAGAEVLDQFMQVIRKHKRSAHPRELPPDSKGPLSYLAEAQQKVGKKNGRS